MLLHLIVLLFLLVSNYGLWLVVVFGCLVDWIWIYVIVLFVCLLCLLIDVLFC